MVKNLSIGVIGIQGAITEHISTMNEALKKNDIHGRVSIVNKPKHFEKLDALIIPGGESTTISKFLNTTELHGLILKRIKEENFPVMGTCAGCVLLAKKVTNDSTKEIKLIDAMDMKVERNAFGRQRESFEKYIHIDGFKDVFPSVFIRAPAIRETWDGCIQLATIEEDAVVMARQNNLLALSFHPELTEDVRIHEYFLREMIL